MGANDAAEMLESAKAECVRLERALATAEATIAAALVKLHPEDEVVRPLLAGYLSERQFGSNPAPFSTQGVLAEHDAKVLEAAADDWHEPNDPSTYAASEWLTARAQVIREGKSDV